ncbi:MAG TPA: PfkB family carbohydrate kinase [Tepidisphaeraceae bacterium]|jgi:sugar/nucleoside kinase (ribokinase family)|nr:PfkB family carbohydrate kinase [Tepidisphaeraceae bacterium]
MALLVTGSIGLDTLETPTGRRDDVLGGSAIYFAYAASFFTPVRLVGVVGEDYPEAIFTLYKGREVDTTGLEIRKGSKTFRWHGSYLKDLNEAVTVEVDLNVLAERAPKIPAGFLDSKYVFLANTHPALQQEMLASLTAPKLIVADTMNLWIQTQQPELRKLLTQVHGLVLNDGEARLLTEEKNLIAAARQVLKMGPKFVVIKKGEHGCLMVSDRGAFVLPAFPAEKVIDPTGAGDSFAGGMMGYLATQGGAVSPATLKRALGYGTVVASFTIADFSLDGIVGADRDQIDDRWHEFKTAMSF